MKTIIVFVLVTAGLMAQTPQRGQRGERGAGTPQVPRKLAWVDRAGKVLGTIGEQFASILDPSISPDGNKVAFRGREKAGDPDSLWVFEGTTKRRVTTNTGNERHMIWSPKGDRIAYSRQETGQGNVSNLYIRAADGSGTDYSLVVSTGIHKWYPTWSPDARFIVFHINDTTTNARDLWFVNVADRTTDVLVATPATEALPRMSPDGRYVAYQSDEGNEPNKTDIWVTTFPKSNNKWKVSTNGGTWVKWGRNEIFYWQGNTLMVARVNPGSTFSAQAPQKLFTGAEVGMGTGDMTSYNPEYDVSTDGSKIIVVQRVN
ncbi:MAG: PD40 domain-containing protein [Acidobacteria bacterium]|nr:PD40 domain-containing protein [Acidobacteriota bacterium]